MRNSCFWQALFSYIVTKNIRRSLRLYIINSAVFSVLHLLSETTKNLATKKKKEYFTNTFYFQDRKISESKQNSVARTMDIRVSVAY